MSVGISEMRGVPGATEASMYDYEGTEGPAVAMLIHPQREKNPRRLHLELLQNDRAHNYDKDGRYQERRAAGCEDKHACGSATRVADRERGVGAAGRTSSGGRLYKQDTPAES